LPIFLFIGYYYICIFILYETFFSQTITKIMVLREVYSVCCTNEITCDLWSKDHFKRWNGTCCH